MMRDGAVYSTELGRCAIRMPFVIAARCVAGKVTGLADNHGKVEVCVSKLGTAVTT